VSVAVFEGTPVPPLSDDGADVVLLYVPYGAVTSTDIVQVPPTAMVPPLKLREVAPAAGANTGTPQFVAEELGGFFTTRPAGKTSVKETLVNAPVLAAGFRMVKVIVLVPFSRIVSGENDLVITGAVKTTSVAEVDVPVTPFVVETFPVLFR
jgi:hypothetical protein